MWLSVVFQEKKTESFAWANQGHNVRQIRGWRVKGAVTLLPFSPCLSDIVSLPSAIITQTHGPLATDQDTSVSQGSWLKSQGSFIHCETWCHMSHLYTDIRTGMVRPARFSFQKWRCWWSRWDQCTYRYLNLGTTAIATAGVKDVSTPPVTL